MRLFATIISTASITVCKRVHIFLSSVENTKGPTQVARLSTVRTSIRGCMWCMMAQ